MNSIMVCEYSRPRSFHDDLILQDQASGERSKDQWSSGVYFPSGKEKNSTWKMQASHCPVRNQAENQIPH